MKPQFFDIETVPESPEVLSALKPLFNPDEVKLGNLKDPAKILEKLTESKAAMEREFLENAALHAHTGRIQMIGWLVEDEVIIDGVSEVNSEADILSAFWKKAHDNMCTSTEMFGFNIHEFDLPFIVRRSWKLRVDVPHFAINGRRWHETFVDLRQRWLMGERTPPKGSSSLDGLCKFFGIKGKEEGLTGADFFKMPLHQQVAYLTNDLRITQEVWRRMH